MSERDDKNYAVVVERLTAAQAHIGRTLFGLANGISPSIAMQDGVGKAYTALGEAWYWLGRLDAERKQEAERE